MTSRYPPFDKIKVSNVVGIFTIKSNINIYPIFRLCQLNGIGSIFYMSYQMYSRGSRKGKGNNKKKKCKKCWRNGISINMSPSINLKLSQTSLKMTGIKSYEEGLSAFNKLKSNLDYVEDTLRYMNDNMDLAKNSVNWIKDVVKGEEIFVIKDSDIIISPEDIVIHGDYYYLNINSAVYNHIYNSSGSIEIQESAILNKLTVKGNNGEIIEYPLFLVEKIRLIKELNNIEINKTCGFSPRLIKFFLDKIVDFNRYDEYCKCLDLILTIKSLFTGGPGGSEGTLIQTGFGYGNINYNYNLEFPVKLSVIDKIFRNNSGFLSDYHKEVAKFVKVSLPMVTPPELKDEIRKKKNKWSHKFTIYKTGAVTESGPHGQLNRIAYEKFISIIEKNYEFLTK